MNIGKTLYLLCLNMASLSRITFMFLQFLGFIAMVFSTDPFDTVDPSTAIFKLIFQNYEKSIRPIKNPNQPTNITFELQRLDILDVDSADESIEINIDYELRWIDENLKWNPFDFAYSVKSIVVSQSDIWQPDMTISGLLERTSLISDDQRKARVYFDGRISVFNPQIIRMRCMMKVDRFPFDKQTCRLNFGAWIYLADEIFIEISNAFISNASSVGNNSEWSIISFRSGQDEIVSNGGNYSDIYFEIVMKRNPQYYVCVLIVPTFIITFLCLLGIFAPTNSAGEREEKVNLGLTTLLTIAVILSIGAGEMPRASVLPLLGYFVMIELIICDVATFVSILIIFYHQRAIQFRTRPPVWLRNYVSRKLNSKHNTTINNVIEEKANSEISMRDNQAADRKRMRASIRHQMEKEDYENDLSEQWNYIFNSVDLICLVFFLFSQVFVLLYLVLSTLL